MYSGESYECHRVLRYNVIRLDLRREFGIIGANICANHWGCHIAELGDNSKSCKQPHEVSRYVD
jgi:hypothetical protein